MRRLRYYLVLYCAFARARVYRFSQYPVDTLLTSLGLFIRELSTFAGILAIASVTGNIGGWNVYELCMVFAFTAMSEALSTLFLSSIWDIGFLVQRGNFDPMLVRPAPVFFQMTASTVHYPATLSFLIPFGILIFSMQKLSVVWGVGTILFLLFSVCCGMIMNSAIYMVANGLNFWIVRGNVADMLEAFREFARYPMHIFPMAIQITLSVVIPFGFVGYYPTLYLTGRAETNIPLLILLVTVVTVLAGGFVWRKGLKGYNSTGT